jgi:hypothetical protein
MALLLAITIVLAMALGIVLGYWTISALLYVLGRRNSRPSAPPALATTTASSGD